MQCAMISVGTPRVTSSAVNVVRSGSITAWYGMNIPNRMNANTRFAPGNRQRASTNPFAEPISDEMIAAGTASESERIKYGCNTSHALRHGSSVQVFGNAHCAAAVVSADVLKLVTTTTYTGVSTNSRNSSSRM